MKTVRVQKFKSAAILIGLLCCFFIASGPIAFVSNAFEQGITPENYLAKISIYTSDEFKTATRNAVSNLNDLKVALDSLNYESGIMTANQTDGEGTEIIIGFNFDYKNTAEYKAFLKERDSLITQTDVDNFRRLLAEKSYTYHRNMLTSQLNNIEFSSDIEILNYSPYVKILSEDSEAIYEDIISFAQNQDVKSINVHKAEKAVPQSAPATEERIYLNKNERLEETNGSNIVGNGLFTGKGVKVGLSEVAYPSKGFLDKIIYYNHSTTGTVSQINHAGQVGATLRSVAPDAIIYSAGTYDFDWFIEQGVSVINCSWGFEDTYQYVTADAIYDYRVQTHLISIVFAAGNDATYKRINSPGYCRNAITATGTETLRNTTTGKERKRIASDASYKSPDSYHVPKPTLGAPFYIKFGAPYYDEEKNIQNKGTSFSAPQVTGALALLFEKEPSLSTRPEQVLARLEASANHGIIDDFDETSGYANHDLKMGAGVLNIEKLLNEVDSHSFIVSDNNKEGQNIAEKQLILKAGQAFKANVYCLGFYYHPAFGDPAKYITNYDLRLYNPSGVLVAQSNSELSYSELIMYTPPVTGTYKLCIIQTGPFKGPYNGNYNPIDPLTIDHDLLGLAYCGHELPYSTTNLPDKGIRIDKVNFNIVGNFVIPEINGRTVTQIHEQAFLDQTKLTGITIPNSVTYIGQSAFKGCSSLTSVAIPSNVTIIGQSAFKNCSSLASITIPFIGNKQSNQTYFGYIFGASSYSDQALYVPSSLKTVILTGESIIAANAFRNCNGLENVIIPNTVTTIGSSIFEGCTNLNIIEIPFVGDKPNNPNKTYFGYLFGAASYNNQDLYIPSSLKTVIVTGGSSIPQYAFYKCASLENIEMPNSVTNIGNYAFYNCNNLINFTMPLYVTSIGDWAFYYCISLTEIVIPNGMNSIKEYAFYDCNSLANITFEPNNSLISIGNSAFSGCSMASIKIPSSVTTIGNYAFSDCSSLANITIPENLTNMGNGVFLNCSSLTDITIPSGIMSIGSSTFANCNKLENIIVQSRITSIGNTAFYNCSSLASLIIPDTVTNIGYGAFFGCSGLTRIEIPFVGDKPNPSQPNFGYLFGATSYYDQNTSLPPGLKTVIITGNYDIPNYAFFGCSSLTNITFELSSSIGSFAFYNCNNLTNIIVPNSVTNIGYNAFYGCNGLTSITLPFVGSAPNRTSNTHFGIIFGCVSYDTQNFSLPSNLTTVTITGDYDIPNCAFFDCRKLTNISISGAVENIGRSAFYNCSGLTSMVIPDSVEIVGDYAFYGCNKLTAINIPASAINIGDYAFSACNSLTSVNIPKNVTKIGNCAFLGCIGLTRIWVDSRNSTYMSQGDCLIRKSDNTLIKGCNASVIPDDVKNIGDYAFSGCSSLTAVNIPASVKSIGNYAFSGCSGLTSIIISSGVANIGDYAFRNCSGLTSISVEIDNSTYRSQGNCLIRKSDNTLIKGCNASVIPDDVKIIGDYAFSDCSVLTTINIPASVTSLGEYAFNNCINLIKIVFEADSQITSLGSYVFYGCSRLTETMIPSGVTIIGKYAFAYCSELTSVVFGSGSRLTSMGAAVFYKCTKLKNIIIPYGITSISDSAFYECISLTSIVIPDSVTVIEKNAFFYCSKLTNTTIPSSVVIIEDYAFCYCKSLKNVIFESGSSLTSIGWFAFRLSGLTNIVLPDNLKNIEPYAFADTNLNSVTLPNSLDYVGTCAFGWCLDLTDIYIDKTSYESGIIYFEYGVFEECESLQRIIVPDSTTLIEYKNNGILSQYDDKLYCLVLNCLVITDIQQAWYYEITYPLYRFNTIYSLDILYYYYNYGYYYDMDMEEYINEGKGIIFYITEMERVYDAQCFIDCNAWDVPCAIFFGPNVNLYEYYYWYPDIKIPTFAYDGYSRTFNIAAEYINSLTENEVPILEIAYNIYEQIGYFPVVSREFNKNNILFLRGLSDVLRFPVKILTSIDEIMEVTELMYLNGIYFENWLFIDIYLDTYYNLDFFLLQHAFFNFYYLHNAFDLLPDFSNFYIFGGSNEVLSYFKTFSENVYYTKGKVDYITEIAISFEQRITPNYLEWVFDIETRCNELGIYPDEDGQWCWFWDSLGYDLNYDDWYFYLATTYWRNNKLYRVEQIVVKV